MKYLNNRRHLDYALIKIPLMNIYMNPVPKFQFLLIIIYHRGILCSTQSNIYFILAIIRLMI